MSRTPLGMTVPIVALMAPVSAQGVSWINIGPGTGLHPGPRMGHVMAYDAARDEIVMYGGWDGSRTRGTWVWTGRFWYEPISSPPFRGNCGMAYDTRRDLTVMFGGTLDTGSTITTNELWERDGLIWRQRTEPGPGPRSGPGVSYDSRRGVTVVFGGVDGLLPGQPLTRLTDTWEWDGTAWRENVTATTPNGDNGPMVYDSARGVCVTVTRESGFKTWEYDGTDWRKVFDLRTATAPYPRDRFVTMTYDARLQKTVVFESGNHFYGTTYGTWTWDGTNWEQSTPARSPNYRDQAAAAYNSRTGETIFFGGWDDLTRVPYADSWAAVPAQSGTATPFGVGCMGTMGTPALDAQTLPWIAESHDLQASNLPPGISSVPFGVLGFSRTQFSGSRLPIPLDNLGMPGCLLLVEPFHVSVLTNVSGSATWPITIPGAAELVGVPFFAQAFVIDPAANALGLTASNGLALTIGAR